MVPPGEPAALVELYAEDSLLLVHEDDSAPRAGAMRTNGPSALESWGTPVVLRTLCQDDSH